MKIFGQLEDACIEQLGADPGVSTQGRVFSNTADGHTKIDTGTAKRSILLNDEKAIIGLSGTASQNIRFHRMAAEILQLVKASDAAADGTAGTLLAQLSAKFENYTSAGRPVFGSPGRIIYLTDLKTISVDIGTAWKDLGLNRATIGNVAGGPYQAAAGDGVRFLNATAGAISVKLPDPASVTNGESLVFQKTDTTYNICTITDYLGAAFTTLNTYGERIVVIFTGAAWVVEARGANQQWRAATFGVSGGLNDNGAAMTQSSFIRREGDSLRCRVGLTNIGVGASPAQIVLPNSLIIDTAKLLDRQTPLGIYNRLTSDGQYYRGATTAPGNGGMVANDASLPDTVYLSFYSENAAPYEYYKFTSNSFLGTGDSLSLDFLVPISGWH